MTSPSIAASIAPVLSPRSVVVVGASRRPEARSLGHSMLVNLRTKNFTGLLAAVNPRAVPGEMIGGVPAYASVTDIPWIPDLAVIAVPAPQVAGALEVCGRAGVLAAVVVSAGFAEIGNREGQDELVEIARRHGIRLIGPNCLGVLNTDPEVNLDATFARNTPQASGSERGGVALAAQSSAFAISVLDAAARRGVGVGSFISLGNKADVSGNDLLLYWADDPRAQVIGLCLESIGNPTRFREIATRISAAKPIVALYSGRSGTPSSPASALALFSDAGVLAAQTTEDFIDLTQLLAAQPVPAGRRLVILGNAEGPARLAANQTEAGGAGVPRLADVTIERLRAVVPGAVSLANPVDLGPDATPNDYQAVLGVLLNSDDADAVLVFHVVTGAGRAEGVIEAVEVTEREHRARTGTKPVTVAGVIIGARLPRSSEIPWYGYVESAARAMAHASWLGAWRSDADQPKAPASQGASAGRR